MEKKTKNNNFGIDFCSHFEPWQVIPWYYVQWGQGQLVSGSQMVGNTVSCWSCFTATCLHCTPTMLTGNASWLGTPSTPVTTYFKATRVVVSPWKLNKWRWSALSAQSGFTGLQALLGRTTNGTKDTFCDTRKSRLTGSWFVQHKHSIKDEHSHLLTTQSWVWCIVASMLGSHCLFGARRYHIWMMAF